MKKLTLALSLLFSLVAGATERSEAEMQKIASNELFGVMTRSAFTPDLQKVETGNTYSIYSAQGRGFVVVSNDDAFKPVLGVSFTEYDAENMPCAFKWWLSKISAGMEKQISEGAASMGKRKSAENYEAVDYFLTTKWGQATPYNMKCPYVNGGRAVTGCAATALAQILKYYKYPEKGVGQNTYYIGDSQGNVTSEKTVSITATYDWDNMIDNYLLGSNVKQKLAVSTLMADCGAATNMIYMPGMSGTSIEDTGEALLQHFGYNQVSVMHYYKLFYTDEEWEDLVYNELVNKRPVMYGGQDLEFGGHAFVLDGIDADGKIHVNWGWEGTADGYYELFKLNPSLSGSELTFADSEQMVCGIKVPTESDTDIPVSQWSALKEYKFSNIGNDTISLHLGNIFNCDLRDFDGDIVIAFENLSGVAEDCLFGTIYSSETVDERGSDGTVPAGYGFTLEEDGALAEFKFGNMSTGMLKPGVYRLYLVTCGYSEGEYPQFLRCPGGPVIYTMEKKDGVLTVYKGDPVDVNGIEGIVDSNFNSVNGVYNLDGMRLPAVKKGFNILRQADGTIKKVMIK